VAAAPVAVGAPPRGSVGLGLTASHPPVGTALHLGPHLRLTGELPAVGRAALHAWLALPTTLPVVVDEGGPWALGEVEVTTGALLAAAGRCWARIPDVCVDGYAGATVLRATAQGERLYAERGVTEWQLAVGAGVSTGYDLPAGLHVGGSLVSLFRPAPPRLTVEGVGRPVYEGSPLELVGHVVVSRAVF